jgi:hypothetical protein
MQEFWLGGRDLILMARCNMLFVAVLYTCVQPFDLLDIFKRKNRHMRL